MPEITLKSGTKESILSFTDLHITSPTQIHFVPRENFIKTTGLTEDGISFRLQPTWSKVNT